MSYTALYRKFRPDNFSDVKGQDHIVTTLTNQIKHNRIGHAYLFCGTRGTGKTTVAKILAKAVNCEHPVDGSPCNQCAMCKAIQAGTAMNVIEIDAASNNGVDNIREIREEVSYRPTEGKYKVYIIDEVHMLSPSAFNALLKIMEEPPAYVKFILATTEIHKVPATITSRCQRYDFRRIKTEDITKRLLYISEKENIKLSEDGANLIAKLADGGMRDALSLLDQCSVCAENITSAEVSTIAGIAGRDYLYELLEAFPKEDTAAAMKITSSLHSMSKDLTRLCEELIMQLRNIMLIKLMDDKAAELIKAGKIREINDMRDETDLGGLKIAIELKRGVDPEKLMQKLFRLTTLQDSFSCNFNILVGGSPRVMGVAEILEEWTAWRTECVRRRVYHELEKKKEKLHLLQGLERILLDIDRAIEIIRGTELEAEVVPNLMVGFGIDQIQAEYVAEIKPRNINREYILRRTAETEELEKDIADLEDVLQSRRRVKNIIIDELKAINKKYPVPRRSSIVYASELEGDDEEEQVEDYPVTLFLSREGYFKKITPQSLRMSGEQKYKDGDSLRISLESSNRCDLLIFTDKQQIYKLRLADMEETKASALGVYLPSRLQMDDGENVLTMVAPGDYKRQLLLVFENGKAARLECSAYETKTNRKKLVNAYSDKSPLAAVIPLAGETDIACYSSDDRALVFNTSLLQTKTSRTTQGVGVMSLKAKRALVRAVPVSETQIKNISRYRVRSLPAAGAILKPEDREEQQLSMIED